MNLQYVAGIIDGEGYVSIDRNAKVGNCLVGRVVVQMATPIIPKMLLKNFGGNYRVYKRTNPNQSDAHAWSLNGLQSRRFLRKIISFLVLKKKHARLVIALYNSKDKAASRNHPSNFRIAYQNRLYQKAKSLSTRKGPGK